MFVCIKMEGKSFAFSWFQADPFKASQLEFIYGYGTDFVPHIKLDDLISFPASFIGYGKTHINCPIRENA